MEACSFPLARKHFGTGQDSIFLQLLHYEYCDLEENLFVFFVMLHLVDAFLLARTFMLFMLLPRFGIILKHRRCSFFQRITRTTYICICLLAYVVHAVLMFAYIHICMLHDLEIIFLKSREVQRTLIPVIFAAPYFTGRLRRDKCLKWRDTYSFSSEKERTVYLLNQFTRSECVMITVHENLLYYIIES